MRRRILSLLFLAAALQAQLLIGTIADITGDNSAHQLSTTALSARWVQIVCPSTNSAAVRIGDSNTSSTRGTPVAAGAGFMLPPSSTAPQSYDLSKLYYYAGTGDKLSVTYGR